ncbi:S66 family peptidase [Salinispira pacifica]|uniref:Muramoyltetrapeptide carboxypeptidase n=1 Tax=Salinispira pacifica TaxID=1307761 RepID=V5WH63_9SPIO|nr:S66 peptidase family protein [Salinispira pacifica]AHC14965.1 Muramoyltetrapeptide carboxypeptidase [Salinispira pacifica]
MSYIKPAALKKGDRVGVISPSAGLPSLFPHIFDEGIKNLQELGLEPVEFPTARMDAKTLYENPALRARDVNAAFADPSIQGIISSIGGSDSIRILPYLDLDVIRDNPKFMMGYSDFTSLHSWIHQQGIITFNGPSIMAGFSQLKSFSEEYQNYINRFLFDAWEEFELPDFPSYSNGYPDWRKTENRGRIFQSGTDNGRRWLQGSQISRGRLFGGCIEVLEMNKGTDYWPAKEFWNGRVLFLETSEEKPPVDYVRYSLRNYGAMGALERISGLLISRPRDYSDKEKADLDSAVLSVVNGEFGLKDLNVVSNMSFGHTDPQVILPQGGEVLMNPSDSSIKIADPVFEY